MPHLIITLDPAFFAALMHHPIRLTRWIWNILVNQRWNKVPVCPLMLREPMRYSPRNVFCDIPGTRTAYLRVARCCSQSGHCRPPSVLIRMARRELEHIPIT
jgi:hypothetical protein